MALGSALGEFFQPVAPGLPGAINPLTFIGAGMASGNIGNAMTQMAGIQQAQQNIAMQQSRLAMLREAQVRKQQEAQRAAAQREMMSHIALGLLPKKPVEAAGPPTAAGEMPTRLANTPEQGLMAMLMPETIMEAAFNYLPIDGGKGGFFHPLTGQVVAAPASRETRGMTREEFLSEYNPSEWTNFPEVLAAGEAIGAYDPAQLQRRIEPAEFRAQADRAQKRLATIEQGVMAGNRVMAALQQATGVGDITAVIGMMKLLDPTSVVSGAEQRVVQSAGSLFDRISGLLNEAKRGEKLTPTLRAEIYDNVMALLDIYSAEGARRRGDLSAQAGAMGIQPGMIMPSEFNWPTEEDYPRPLVGSEVPSPKRQNQLMQMFGGP